MAFYELTTAKESFPPVDDLSDEINLQRDIAKDRALRRKVQRERWLNALKEDRSPQEIYFHEDRLRAAEENAVSATSSVSKLAKMHSDLSTVDNSVLESRARNAVIDLMLSRITEVLRGSPLVRDPELLLETVNEKLEVEHISTGTLLTPDRDVQDMDNTIPNSGGNNGRMVG